MKANFYLTKNHSQKKNGIRLQCAFDGNVLKYSTGITIEIERWDKDKQEIKGNKAKNDNIRLGNIKQSALNEYEDYKRANNKPFTKEYLKQFLDNIYTNVGAKPEFIEDYFIKYIEDQFNRVGEKTNAKYKTFYKHLLNFQVYFKKKVKYSDLNESFYNKFIDYFVFELKHENRTIKEKHISVLKSFVNWSVNKHIDKNPLAGLKFPFKISPADTVSLSENELNTLYNLELTNERLIKTRDIFCLECFCGVRYSDMDKVLPQNLKGNHLDMFPQKTHEKLHIPLRPDALKLINKYFGKAEAFPTLSNQKLNDFTKELCEIAGFNEPITIMRSSGKTKTTEVYKKFELISTHTARRTFATLSYLRGIDPYVIMKITGHKDLKTFQIYLRLDQLQVSEKFFNAYADVIPTYSSKEIIENFMKAGIDKKIIADALGIEVDSI